MRSDNELNPELAKPDDWLNDWQEQKPVSPAAFSFSGHERNHLFLSQDAKQFVDVSAISGLDSDCDGRAFAWLDYDRDGWQDFAVVNANAPMAMLYRNELGSNGTTEEQGQMIAVRFEGGNEASTSNSEFSCRDGYGALVTVGLGDTSIVREHRCGEGLAAQNSATMILGVGSHELVDFVRVQWPSGRVQETRNVAAGTLLTFSEKASDQSDQGIKQEPYIRSLSTPPNKKIADSDEQNVAPLPAAPTTDGIGDNALVMYTTMATWCPSCKEHLPALEHLRQSFPKEQLRMMGAPIDDEDSAEELIRYVKKFHPAYTMLSELPLENRAWLRNHVVELFDQEVLPVTVLTDQSGEIIDTFAGIPTVSDLRLYQEQLRPEVEAP